MNIDLGMTGQGELARALRRIGNNANNMRPLMDHFADHLERTAEDRFERGGKPRWRKLAKSTLARKRRQGLPLRPLFATGRLYRSLKGGAEHVRRIRPDGFEVGTRDPVARLHQPRRAKKGRRLPRRTIVTLTKQDREAWRHDARRWLLGPHAGNGR